jgi:hypothetical protein
MRLYWYIEKAANQMADVRSAILIFEKKKFACISPSLSTTSL